MSTTLHQTQPQVAIQEPIHQTPYLHQRHMKHNLAAFHIDLRYHFELTHSAPLDPYAIPQFSTKFTLQLQLAGMNLVNSGLSEYFFFYQMPCAPLLPSAEV